MLASGSPRRRELLSALGLEFRVEITNVDESLLPAEEGAAAAERLARAKAVAALSSVAAETLVIAADTLVVLDRFPLGKPLDDLDAARMLRALSGRRHEVVTGVAVARNGRLLSAVDTTAVFFGVMSETEITRYIASGEPDDKAGAYGLQGRGALLIDRIEGSPSSVVGLPLRLLRTLSTQVGVELL